MSSPSQINPDIFKAYDVRGIYPTELNEDAAYRIGRAFVQYLGVNQVAVGRDMRVSSPAIAAAIIRGITEQGADAIDLGLTTTDELYFAVGKFSYPAGVMITASHNPGQYNGMKMCREEAIPISLRDRRRRDPRHRRCRASSPRHARTGQVIQRDVTDAYVRPLSSRSSTSARSSRYKIAVDAGNGMAGMIMPRVFAAAALRAGPALLRAGRHVPQSSGQPHRAGEYRGVAARRCQSNTATWASPSTATPTACSWWMRRAHLLGGDMVTALVAHSLLRKHPGATILYNLICSRSVPELIERDGGRAIRTRVGHSFIKAQMRRGERDLRRRAFRPLLLPRQLVRRLRPDRLPDRAGVSERERQNRLGTGRDD